MHEILHLSDSLIFTHFVARTRFVDSFYAHENATNWSMYSLYVDFHNFTEKYYSRYTEKIACLNFLFCKI